MAINLVVTIEPTIEAVERKCGVGSHPTDVIEALAFQGMIVWTWSRVLLIKPARELKLQVSFLKNWRYLFEASMLSKVKEIGA
jgi:hypothetical protein